MKTSHYSLNPSGPLTREVSPSRKCYGLFQMVIYLITCYEKEEEEEETVRILPFGTFLSDKKISLIPPLRSFKACEMASHSSIHTTDGITN